MSEYSFAYAIPWILLTITFLIIGWLEYKYGENARLSKLSALIFLVFFGLRGFVGWDYASYFPAYEDTVSLFGYGTLFDKVDDIGWEWGFSFYMVLCKSITSNYHVFIFISVFIDTILLYKFFGRHSVNIGLSYALFIVFSSSMEIDLLRNTKAIFICLLALPYIFHRKPFQYFILIALAISFHFTAIIFIPLYFFLHRQISRKIIILLFITGNIFYFLDYHFVTSLFEKLAGNSNELLLKKTEIYINSGNFDNKWGLSFGFIERTATWILLIIFSKRIIEKRPEAVLFVNATLIYLMSFFLIFNIHTALLRMSLLFSFAYWIIYPLFWEKIQENSGKIVRLVFFLSILGYCLIRTSMKTTIMDKYESVIFNNSTFMQKMSDTNDARVNESEE